MYSIKKETDYVIVTCVVFSTRPDREKCLSIKVYESVILRNVQKLPNFSCSNFSVWKVGMNKQKL